jgi:hypothetical protein
MTGSLPRRMGRAMRARPLRPIWGAALIPILLVSSILTGRETFAAAPALVTTCDSAALAVCVNDTTFGNGAYLIVAGTGLEPGKFVAAWIDVNGSNGLDLTEPWVKAFTDPSGAFSIPLRALDVPVGTYQMVAGVCPSQTPTDDCLGTTGEVSTSVTIAMSTDPYRFGSGTTLTVTGAGFAPGAPVNVWFDRNNNSALDAGEAATSTTASASGAFSATVKASALPGDYFVRAGPSTTATTSTAVQIATCWFQECFIDGADTICILGNSPTDPVFFIPDCKKIDSSYSEPTPATPNGGYDLTNVGPRFVGAGALAAASNDIIPLAGCAPMQLAIANARAYGNVVPDADFDLLKPLTDLTDIACGDVLAGVPPIELVTYMSLEAVGGNVIPDAPFLLLTVGAIQTAAAAASVAAIAAGFAATTLGPDATLAAFQAISGISGLDPATAASIASAVGASVVALGAASFAAAPILTAAILVAAQQALAMAAVAGAIACGHVNFYCDGADITATILGSPQLQQAQVPIEFLQPPFKAAPNPNPCRAAVGAPVLNGTCWGDIIGWGNVLCKGFDRNCETSPPGLPNLPVPGSAGPDNLAAPLKCATGKVGGLSIGYDGDVSLDVFDPSILPLMNYHNFLPGPGGTEPPNGIDIEIPLTDRDKFKPAIENLRPGMVVKACGWWVADMHMLWNELHPLVTLDILSDTSVSIASPAANADLPTGTTTVTATIKDIGTADTQSCTVGWDGAAPVAAMITVAPTSSTPGTCVGSTTGLAAGAHSATISVTDGDSSSGATASVNFTINAPPVLALAGPQTVQYGGSVSFGISASDIETGDTISLGASGLPAGLAFTDHGNRTGSVSGSPQVGVGSYTVTFTASDGINAPVSGTVLVVVTPAPASISAVVSGKIYGSPDPVLSTTNSGFLAADLGATKITVSAARAAGENVGTYTITPTADDHHTGLLGNYTVVSNTAAFVVTPKPASIAAVAAGKIVGGADPVLSTTNSGFLATDLGATKITVSATRDAGESVGTYTITPMANDHSTGLLANYSVATYTASFTITYGVCVLYDQTKAVQSGSTIPIKVELCNAGAADLSTAAIVVTATGVTRVSTSAAGALEASGNANPDNNFRFDSTLGSGGGYIYNLSTKGLGTGTYALTFRATNDPVAHIVQFQVK